MVRNLIIITLLFVCFSNCKQVTKVEKQTVLINKKDNSFQKCISNLTPYDNKINEQEYFLENDEGFFLEKNKTEKNNSCVINFLKNTYTNHSDDFFYNLKEKKYFPVFKKILQNNIVIASFVEYYGENDIPGILLQFNLFDFQGKQIDYLIVFNRFSSEISIEYEFTIDNIFSEIKINKKEEDWLLFDDEGEMVGERKEPLRNIKKEVFLITKKGFVRKKQKTYLTIDSTVYAQVESYLNVRSAPTSEGEIIAKAYPQDGLKVLEVLDGWVKIELNGKQGYVSSEFVK